MTNENFSIENINATLWGDTSDSVYIYVHGKNGCGNEAEAFAEIITKKGWQVISFDLPEHGMRKNETDAFNPWKVIPELKTIMQYTKKHWNKVGLYANSIGAWFSMLSFREEKIENCLFVSPILDMEKLIKNMMAWAYVTEEQLKQQKEIKTEYGETLSWEYFTYAKENPINMWNNKTNILYGDKDNLTEMQTVKNFTEKFGCKLTVMENGEHWFHTSEQLTVLNNWITASF